MRAVDAMLSFPPFVLAIFVLTFMGPKLENLILTIGILFIPRYARVAHVVTLAAKERDYVEAARSIGARAWRIIGLAILPNVFAPLIVQISLGVRSEEHTSELQSLAYLVCRLLLEKKHSTARLPGPHPLL